jgi:hypothetical protein
MKSQSSVESKLVQQTASSNKSFHVNDNLQKGGEAQKGSNVAHTDQDGFALPINLIVLKSNVR